MNILKISRFPAMDIFCAIYENPLTYHQEYAICNGHVPTKNVLYYDKSIFAKGAFHCGNNT